MSITFSRPSWALTISFIMFAQLAFSMEDNRITEYEISTIAEILAVLPADAKNVAVGVDWDQSTILGDGDDESGLREGSITRDTFRKILLSKANLFIITSRYAGSSFKEIDEKFIEHRGPPPEYCAVRVAKAMDATAESMLSRYELFPPEHQTFLFSSKTARCVELSDKDLNRSEPCLGGDAALITPNVVFAGAHNEVASSKGIVMTMILDLHAEALKASTGDSMFTSRNEINHVIFVDNDYDHIVAMKKAFQDRAEKLTVFYFPIDEQ